MSSFKGPQENAKAPWWVGALERYRDLGIPPGGWLQAILEDDFELVDRVASAENKGSAKNREVLKWVEQNLPEDIYGSEEKFAEHRRTRGQ